MDPLVSFVVPCYNYGRYVTDAIDSVLRQSIGAVEVIAIDDCSTDDTPAVLARYGGDERVRVVRHERNMGHIATYNEGLEMARGRYLGLLSADDYCLRPDTLARMVAMFEAHPRVGLVYSTYTLVEDGRSVGRVASWPEDRVSAGYVEFKKLLWENQVPASGTLLRRELQDEIGLYDAALPHAGDVELWLRAAMRSDFGYIAEPLFAYRLHQANMGNTRFTPEQATDQLLLAMRKTFAALPADAPADVRAIRGAALQHALLHKAQLDVWQGRTTRTWRGVRYALRKDPGIVRNREFRALLPWLLLLTCLGKQRFWRTAGRLRGLRAQAGAAAVA